MFADDFECSLKNCSFCCIVINFCLTFDCYSTLQLKEGMGERAGKRKARDRRNSQVKICVFVYLSILVFVYLCICIFEYLKERKARDRGNSQVKIRVFM